MKRGIIYSIAFSLLLFITGHAHIPFPAVADQGRTSATSPGFSPFDPAPIGVTIKTSIQCGQAYSSHEPYDIKITLLEVLRGDQVWEHIKTPGETNRPSKDFDYILARIRLEYFARGAPGNCGHELSREQFIAYSAEGMEYKPPSIIPPKPELKGVLYSGDSLEGWVVFSVAKKDGKPLMTFNAEPGGAVDHGGNVWFRLE